MLYVVTLYRMLHVYYRYAMNVLRFIRFLLGSNSLDIFLFRGHSFNTSENRRRLINIALQKIAMVTGKYRMIKVFVPEFLSLVGVHF